MPKFLLLENVSNLVSKQHRKSFDLWLKKLNKLSYKTTWAIIDSSNFGIIQKRKRVYALSIYDPYNQINWNDNTNDLNLKLEEIYKNKYQPKNKKQIEEIIDFNNSDQFEANWSKIKNTPSRLRMIEASPIITKDLAFIPTITTKQDRLPNCGSIFYSENNSNDENNLEWTNKRFISPKEAFLLMGFNEEKYQLAKEQLLESTKHNARTKNMAREKLYKQAGNSICVNVLELIFYLMNEINEKYDI